MRSALGLKLFPFQANPAVPTYRNGGCLRSRGSSRFLSAVFWMQIVPNLSLLIVMCRGGDLGSYSIFQHVTLVMPAIHRVGIFIAQWIVALDRAVVFLPKNRHLDQHLGILSLMCHVQVGPRNKDPWVTHNFGAKCYLLPHAKSGGNNGDPSEKPSLFCPCLV